MYWYNKRKGEGASDMLKDNSQMSLELSPYKSLYDMIIPEKHLLRRIKEHIDFSFVNPMLRKQYCEHFGRPAKEPEMMFKLMFLKKLYDLSDERLISSAQTDMAFKGDKYRNVPLLEKTKKHLLAYLRKFHTDSDKKEPLFYATMNGQKHSLSSDTLENLIKSSAKAACNKGIEMPTRCHCHMIRKTRAMDLYQSGVPLTHIQQLLGHEDISTTSGFYAFATLDTLSASMAKVDASTKDEKLWKDPKAMKRLYRL